MARPAAGYKNAAGREIPGSTTITGRYKDSGGLINWAYKRGQEDGPGPFRLYQTRDEAGAVGTHIHNLIEADVQGIALPSYPAEFTEEQRKQAASGFESYGEWKQGTHFTVVKTEVSLVSERLQTGGTIDAVAYANARLCIGDWKSSKDFYIDQLIQLAFYLDLWEENYPDQPLHGIHIIRFGKSGYNFSHHFYRRDDPKVEIARKLFPLYRQAFDLDRALK